jgi:hypothetical protein
MSTSWRSSILEKFTPEIATASRLTIVSDPDELLTEESVVDELRRRGFELIPFEDHVAFRYAYESHYRAAWDAGTATNLVVVLRTASSEVDRLPFDLLATARRHDRILHFSLAELFPRLVPAVVRTLERSEFDALYAACEELDGPLGDNATRDFILGQVFDVYPSKLKTPEVLLRWLLDRHHRQRRYPEALDERVLAVLRKLPQWREWPLEQLLRDRSAFLQFLQERWPLFLERQRSTGAPGVTEPPDAPYGLVVSGPVELPFEALKALVDTYFLDGLLKPVEFPADLLKGSWVTVGVVREDMVWSRFHRLLDGLGEPPGADAPRSEWLAFAGRWAEWSALRWQLAPARLESMAERIRSLHDSVEATFATWMVAHFGSLTTLPVLPRPAMLHHVPQFLAHKFGPQAKRALVVIDGLAMEQWTALREAVAPAYEVDEHAVFAWVPTLTSISRQSIFAGTPPMFYAASIGTTYKEEAHWLRFWADQGVAGPGAVAYACQGKGIPWASFLGTVREAVSKPRCRVAGIVLNVVDQTMHGMTLGSSGMFAQVQHWAGLGEFRALLDLLHDQRFEVFLTADHGNIAAMGVGKPDVGEKADARGQRAHIFRDHRLFEQLAVEHPDAIRWPTVGLPPDFLSLLAPGRTAFVKEQTEIVCHGGLSLEEVIVPFVRFARRP